ncbi:MAG: glycogen debranching enzyme, partial [Actinomycetota bacterium]|nr:glycogen debranching enzyme [Actinomycetota bacterium]
FLGGDEMGRTQHGNNNAYCQDNEVSWFDWGQREENLILLGWMRRVMDFRASHPVFRRRGWFQGRPLRGAEVSDIAWFDPSGDEMGEEQWEQGFAHTVGVYLNGEQIAQRGPRGEKITDDSFLLLFNAHDSAIDFTLPSPQWADEWAIAIDTNEPLLEEGSKAFKAGEEVAVEGRSVVVLQRVDRTSPLGEGLE